MGDYRGYILSCIILTIKSGEEYDEYLDNYKIQELIRKYSDYITVPINMDVEHRHLKEKKNEKRRNAAVV